jgi:Fe-S-cluster containining protein
MIAKHADGYCVHLDRCGSRCRIYEQRPTPCRGYDCRKDKRIWIDFERRIVNPKLEEVFSQSSEDVTEELPDGAKWHKSPRRESEDGRMKAEHNERSEATGGS